jgi:Ca2+-binding EF-hand superfamily protein
MRAQHMEERFNAADINRDGKLGRVEVDEKLPRLKDRFAWLDENRDGFLSRAELQAAHGHR